MSRVRRDLKYQMAACGTDEAVLEGTWKMRAAPSRVRPLEPGLGSPKAWTSPTQACSPTLPGAPQPAEHGPSRFFHPGCSMPVTSRAPRGLLLWPVILLHRFPGPGRGPGGPLPPSFIHSSIYSLHTPCLPPALCLHAESGAQQWTGRRPWPVESSHFAVSATTARLL